MNTGAKMRPSTAVITVATRLRLELGRDRFPESSFRRLRFAMKLAAAHQPTSYVRRL